MPWKEKRLVTIILKAKLAAQILTFVSEILKEKTKIIQINYIATNLKRKRSLNTLILTFILKRKRTLNTLILTFILKIKRNLATLILTLTT